MKPNIAEYYFSSARSAHNPPFAVPCFTRPFAQKSENFQGYLGLVSECIENVFDQPARLESFTEEEMEALPHAYVGFLASSLLDEIDKASPGDIWNSRLTLVVSGGRARFLLREVRGIPVRTPIVVLDAYANKDYYSKLLGRNVKKERKRENEKTRKRDTPRF